MSLKLPLSSEGTIIQDADGCSVASMVSPKSYDQDKQNAAELVRLANQHAELLEAVEGGQMKTPMFFDVERAPSMKEKIRDFKRQHNIFTHRSELCRKDQPWSALLIELGDKREPVQIIAEECTMLADAGRLVTGEGELSAIRILCQNNSIHCPL